MQPSPCTDLGEQQQGLLLEIARRAIREGQESGKRLVLEPADFDDELGRVAAVFVTLTLDAKLRGCIGSLQASTALAQAVADSAFNSALQDPRFEPLPRNELDAVSIEISVLSAPQPLAVSSRDDLLAKLRPGVDGLIVEDGGKRATFLPKVWESLATPERFVDQLMLKAGFHAGHWSSKMRVQRYSTFTFCDK